MLNERIKREIGLCQFDRGTHHTLDGAIIICHTHYLVAQMLSHLHPIEPAILAPPVVSPHVYGKGEKEKREERETQDSACECEIKK